MFDKGGCSFPPLPEPEPEPELPLPEPEPESPLPEPEQELPLPEPEPELPLPEPEPSPKPSSLVGGLPGSSPPPQAVKAKAEKQAIAIMSKSVKSLRFIFMYSPYKKFLTKYF